MSESTGGYEYIDKGCLGELNAMQDNTIHTIA